MYAFYDSAGTILSIIDSHTPNDIVPANPGTPIYLDDSQYANVRQDPGEYKIQNGTPVYTPIPDSVKLANAKTAQIAQLEAGRDATLEGCFSSKTTGHTYVTTTNGQTNMEGDLKRFELDSTLTSVQFYTVDAGWVAHSHQDLINAFLDGGKWKDAQYTQCNNLISQVTTLASQSGTTVAQIQAITWTPATY